METVKKKLKSAGGYVLAFFKWLALAVVTGLVGGAVGTLFHVSVEYVTGLRKDNPWIILLLPVGGIVIAGLYRLCGKKDIGTNEIIVGIAKCTCNYHSQLLLKSEQTNGDHLNCN